MGTSADQEWLFRQGDLVLGPVPSAQIIDKLYSGELNGASEIRTIEMPTFAPVSVVPEFAVHLAKAEVQRRVTADHNAFEVARRVRRNRLIAVIASSLVVVGVGVAALGSYLAVHGGFQSAEEVAWGDITMDELVIARATRATGEELFDYQGPAHRRTEPASRTNPRSPQTPTSPTSPSLGALAAAQTGAPGKPKTGTADPDGLQMGEVDQEGINAVIAQKRPTLVPCLKEIAKPGVVAKIPIEFSIAEGGRVGRVWVDNPDYKEGPLATCLLRELQKWPFKGAQAGATVQLSFSIGRKN